LISSVINPYSVGLTLPTAWSALIVNVAAACAWVAAVAFVEDVAFACVPVDCAPAIALIHTTAPNTAAHFIIRFMVIIPRRNNTSTQPTTSHPSLLL